MIEEETLNYFSRTVDAGERGHYARYVSFRFFSDCQQGYPADFFPEILLLASASCGLVV